ncbi:Translocon at the inner envelope membrane of chloroplasts 32 [Hyphodiscus hymeniophilus]|uniref:Translocon at the inner envelope membrane of chloroplasts 32 n=1 Tax=Hyphodiscus hymeniophilus TaxID=353542 RepID=A0A9P6SQX2_9HELO|nr:Translocon at the inner envelope membrane of chloroplasts 32 [Hyphodiscus hymeniophilus]
MIFDKTTSGDEVVRTFAEQVRGKTIVITGPSSGGLGAQTALCLSQAKPAEILLLGRDESKTSSVTEEIKSISPQTLVKFVHIDLASYSSIRAAVATIDKSVPEIDILINNAGIMAVTDYTLTPEGIESQFGSNHIGHFLFTNLLMDKILAAGKGARIINLTSIGHQMSDVRFDDYNFENGKTYDPWLAYGQSKTANILFSVALAEKLGPKGILSFAAEPGTIYTNLGRNVPPETWPAVLEMAANKGYDFKLPYKNLNQGAATTLIAALDPSLEAHSGSYLHDSVIDNTPEYAHDSKLAERLWALSEKLVGQKFSY